MSLPNSMTKALRVLHSKLLLSTVVSLTWQGRILSWFRALSSCNIFPILSSRLLVRLLRRSRLPHEVQLIQLFDAFFADVAGLILAELFVLPPLALHPDCELRVLTVRGGYVAVPVQFSEFLELVQSSLPLRCQRVPYESDVVEHCDALRCHSRLLAFVEELELVSLTLHPTKERWVPGVSVGHQAMTVGVAKLDELLVPCLPLFGLEDTEAPRRCR
mmetsp:Transcript_6603/g.17924  ORF Transcript_6603/g.17924 Transcript_6603/m.17924 type:complete len:217 (+) Transcript_6603:100-750(+)